MNANCHIKYYPCAYVVFAEYNLILFIRQVLLRIVVWNVTLQSVTSSRQRHSYILKFLLKI